MFYIWERNVNDLYTVITFIMFGIFMGQANGEYVFTHADSAHCPLQKHM